jgi:primary-amine oxidase
MTTVEERASLHPLSPLSPAELEHATALLKSERSLTDDFQFVTVTLDEPQKAQLRAWPEEPVPRRVFVVGLDLSTRTVHEALVCLTTEQIVEWRDVPGVQPKVIYGEWEIIEPLVKNDPRWQEAMRRRGITDFDLAYIETWGGGYLTEADHPSKGRFFRPLTYVKTHANGNPYARPVGGLTVLIDRERAEVVEVVDHEIIPIPGTSGEYIPELMLNEPDNRPRYTQLRDDIKAVEITQPDGPSFVVDGHRVTWQKWSFIVGWTQREGLVLFDVTYNDRGRVRPILHRAAISEMAVPYGDSSPTQFRKMAFDAGSVGLGLLSTQLTPGCDCLGYIHYFDGLANMADGSALVLEDAICMHEEDVGIGWKHLDWDGGGTVETRRMRRLVISTIANAANYEYGFFWYLYQDGTIELECKMTGVMQTGALRTGEDTPPYGTTIAPGLYAPNHQHYFCVRLDMTVDGPGNTVTEVNSVSAPAGPDNPGGNAWMTQETVLRRESEAQRNVNVDSGRFWRIINPNERTDLGTPTAYRLVPGGNARPLHQPDSPMLRRMSFATKHLWVTPARKDEMYAAGMYTWQNPGPDGLPKWTQADRPIENEDLAVWYVFGSHHVPRVEEWPVMPVDRIGFQLRPDGFFDGNPALDLPRPAGTCEHTK